MFELKLGDGKIVTWEGKDGPAAARRYADAHPGVVVVAWRYPRYDLVIGLINIVP